MGWSIADHIRTELVVDALQMARWQREPVATIVHADRGPQYTSWVFGHRLREAGAARLRDLIADGSAPALPGYGALVHAALQAHHPVPGPSERPWGHLASGNLIRMGPALHDTHAAMLRLAVSR